MDQGKEKGIEAFLEMFKSAVEEHKTPVEAFRVFIRDLLAKNQDAQIDAITESFNQRLAIYKNDYCEAFKDLAKDMLKVNEEILIPDEVQKLQEANLFPNHPTVVNSFALHNEYRVIEVEFKEDDHKLTQMFCNSIHNATYEHGALYLNISEETARYKEYLGLYDLAKAGDLSGREVNIKLRAIAMNLEIHQQIELENNFPVIAPRKFPSPILPR
ncbi:MAG: hypothetical protein ACRBFS_19335 [Aureispira sp.]